MNGTGDDRKTTEDDLAPAEERFLISSASLPEIPRWRTPEEVKLIVRNILAAIQALDQGQEVYEKWAAQHFSPEHRDLCAPRNPEELIGMDSADLPVDSELERKLLEIFTPMHEIEYLGDGWSAEEIAPGVLGVYGPAPD